jgi:hypothetical protein
MRDIWSTFLIAREKWPLRSLRGNLVRGAPIALRNRFVAERVPNGAALDRDPAQNS